MLAIALGWLTAACGESEPEEDAQPTPGFDQAAVDELRSLGVDRYFDRFEPSAVTNLGDGQFGVEFEVDEEGPICLRGAPYRFGIRERDSEDLLIFLQGGGACWSEFCAAQTATSVLVPTHSVMDEQDERSVMPGYNVAHIAYCDGSVFTGDTQLEDEQGVRYHRGLVNLSAALDVVNERFPEPRRVVLAGTSAGGYGTILGTLLVRLKWPTTPLDVINDAGLGLTNPERPQTLALMKQEWGFGSLIPPSCPECSEQFTQVIGWALKRDPTLRVGVFSAYEDEIVSGPFLSIDPLEFTELLLSETDKLSTAYPQRFKRFFVTGDHHTAVPRFYDHEVNGVPYTSWLKAMLSRDPSWVDMLADPPTP